MFKDLGSTLFKARTAFYNLKKILQSMLEDEVLETAYLVIDALDACRNKEPGLLQLLQLISEFSETHDKVKWLVSSRNIPEIEICLEEHKTKTRLSLELNAESVAGAVETYIDYKMLGLAERYQKIYAASKDLASTRNFEKSRITSPGSSAERLPAPFYGWPLFSSRLKDAERTLSSTLFARYLQA